MIAGDLWSYNQDTKQFIVSPEPDVSVLQLDANDKFLVLASDGLTNVLKAQQIADIVYSYECEGRDEVRGCTHCFLINLYEDVIMRSTQRQMYKYLLDKR